MSLSEDDVREILRLIDESDVEELRVETGGLSLYVRREPSAAAVAEAREPESEVAAEQEPEPAPAPAPETDGDLVAIRAPMLGTFYRAQAPGKPPFVELGGRVQPETVVCLIEVMKMMNSIPAGVAGTIVEVCADNAALVEYGQPLFRVEPA
jgi:acetyl-CoA carboxylase biotin carboxyl carrier protein